MGFMMPKAPAPPVIPPTPVPSAPLAPTGTKPQAKADNSTVLGAIALNQQQQTSGTKTLLGA